MKHYCEKRDPWTGKVYPDCRTWDQCHHRGICLAAPKAKADENHAKERHSGRIDCPPFQRLYRVGKRASGRQLDGREWNELPEVLR